MRVIHSRKKVFSEDKIFENKFSLLVWMLSALSWKKLGYTTIMYADNYTLEKMKEFYMEDLYDEINTNVLSSNIINEVENNKNIENINFYYFWAMPKLLSLKHEMLELNNKEVIISDSDVVITKNIENLLEKSDVVVWSNKEYVEFNRLYPTLNKLSIPTNYKFPKWFTGNSKPLNTGIIYIKDKNIVDLYINNALLYAKYNNNIKKNNICVTMCNAEQRMLGEIVNYKKLKYSTIQPINEGLFNTNGFHTHGYKNFINNNNCLNWCINFMLMIKDYNIGYFNKIINLSLFKEEKNYFKKNGYKKVYVKELENYIKGKVIGNERLTQENDT